MKKQIVTLALATFASISSMAAIQGIVTVNSTQTSITGQMNVGPNPAAGHNNSYIWTNGYANSSVGFGGYDAVNGRSFYCTVASGTALYNAAVAIRNGAGNHTYLRVNKGTSGSACTSIFILKDSRRHN
ncbi:hypothetical protein [Pleionea sp. CnH1-48]|uniref:hypothetical protein n=1 Tax=Pleionea sp. CnH1-48 TaxID=2954494 RepID=UPI002097E2C5|nr:hypothetical protein [Pleionea sp. CnH1-48]MCO7224919.1 hypothetical protein [Pleionea sp. CnH1-48]